jgi:type IV pilus assembly protein PilV
LPGFQRRNVDYADGGIMSVRKTAGFAMLEVLIAMVVILFGVLGIAGMQMYAINNTENARYQSLATVLASSMSAKMQANVAYWGTPPPSVTLNGSTITGGPSTYAGSCVNAVCTAQQMASFDLQNWGADIASGLPSGTAKMTCSTPSGTPSICTLTITWSEKNVALTNATGGETGAFATGTLNSNYTYQTLVNMQL